MTDFAPLLAADGGEQATPLHLVAETGLEAFRATLSDAGRMALDAAGFRGAEDSAVFLPAGDGHSFLLAVGTGKRDAPGRFALAAAIPHSPAGLYRPAGRLPREALHGWLMAQHHFSRYRKPLDSRGPRTLLLGDPADLAPALADAEAAALVRDLVDTPADDMGPAEIEAAIADLARDTGGRLTVVRGDDLAGKNFPLIHAVGRASPRAPRIVVADWGTGDAPLVALVGKGVCFDSGGLDLKSASGMALMKKDMGGAAHALALARLVLARRLPVRLKLVVATVDNVVAGNALHPGDVLQSRKGLTVEVGNTDAEGRLILADALALASEAAPALVIDFATLTGAARVALGPDLPALFTNSNELAAALASAGERVDDPIWRLPLWAGYRRLFRSTIADCNNVSDSGFAGSVIAALFLQQFLPEEIPWAHFDLYAWSPAARPGRPRGAREMALYAALFMLEQRFR